MRCGPFDDMVTKCQKSCLTCAVPVNLTSSERMFAWHLYVTRLVHGAGLVVAVVHGGGGGGARWWWVIRRYRVDITVKTRKVFVRIVHERPTCTQQHIKQAPPTLTLPSHPTCPMSFDLLPVHFKMLVSPGALTVNPCG